MARSGLEEITPELVQMMAEYFGINEDAALQKILYAQAQKARETPMPEGITVRNQYIAPSVLGTAASTIERIRGGQDEQAALAKLQSGILRKKDINEKGLSWALEQQQKDAAAAEAEATAKLPHPATPEEQEFMGKPPVEYGVGRTDFIPDGELSHTSGPGPAPRKAAGTLPLPITTPLTPGGMSPNPNPGWLPVVPGETLSTPPPNPLAKPRSPFRGYERGGLWPLPGGK